MARTALTPVTLTANTVVSDPAGTSRDARSLIPVGAGAITGTWPDGASNVLSGRASPTKLNIVELANRRAAKKLNSPVGPDSDTARSLGSLLPDEEYRFRERPTGISPDRQRVRCPRHLRRD